MSCFDRYSFRQLEEMPLLALHGLLARMEAEIDEVMAGCLETTTMPGTGYRAKWECVREPEDVRDIYPISERMRTEFIALAKLCRSIEEKEIAALRGKAA